MKPHLTLRLLENIKESVLFSYARKNSLGKRKFEIQNLGESNEKAQDIHNNNHSNSEIYK